MDSEYLAASAQADGMPAGEAVLSIALRHPAMAFLYRATSPRLQVDGVDVPVPGWGTHRVPAVPGRRRVQVWVPYVIPRRVGRAEVDVDVPVGTEVELEYSAPTITLGRGGLGPPGQQSAGWSAVMVFNGVTVVAVLVLAVLALLL